MTVKEFLNKMSVTSSTETIELFEHTERAKLVQVLDYTSIRTGDCHGFEDYRVDLFAICKEKLLIYISKLNSIYPGA